MFFTAIIKGIAIGLMLSISVGPVIFAIIKQSLNNGHKGGFFFIAGVSFSDTILVMLCNLFTQLFSAAGWLEKLIGYGGSIFLVILGIYNFFVRKQPKKEDLKIIQKQLSTRDKLSIFFSGFAMNTLNPAVIIFWIATSGTIMVDAKSYAHDIEYRLIVFVTCLVFTLGADICKVFLAGKIRKKLTPHNIHVINQIAGVIFIIFGCVLFYGMYSGHNILSH
ncbi:MAG: LysE family translocator [Arachidicoccus sp.]|nr:LysE family translocator [Arachidicoccus sp.]